MPKLETTYQRESIGDRDARLSVRVTIDGLDCGSVVICSGPRHDIDDFIAGDITLPALRERWEARWGLRLGGCYECKRPWPVSELSMHDGKTYGLCHPQTHGERFLAWKAGHGPHPGPLLDEIERD